MNTTNIAAFIFAAAPWVILGIGVAMLAVCGVSEHKEKAGKISKCMGIGIAIGGLGAFFNIWNSMYGLSLGLLVGMLVGIVWSKLAR